jgi:hypothetical protein
MLHITGIDGRGQPKRSELWILRSEPLLFTIKSCSEFVILGMRYTHSKIGFDDRLVLVIGLLILPFIIHLIFFEGRMGQHSFITWQNYWTGLVFATTIWIGNRYIMIWSRARYPDFEDVKKRLRIQSLIMLAYTLVANNLLGVLLKDACAPTLINGIMTPTPLDLLLISNYASIFCSLLIVAIYESIYFMGVEDTGQSAFPLQQPEYAHRRHPREPGPGHRFCTAPLKSIPAYPGSEE